MLVFTGVAHFVKTDLMIEMIPDFIPFKKETVYLSGLIEIIAAIGLFKKYSKTYQLYVNSIFSFSLAS